MIISILTIGFFVVSGAVQQVPTEHSVVRVIDGDTIVVIEDGKEEKVRLVGIDTPETVDPRRPVQCFGLEASAYVKKLLPTGTIVGLVRDAQSDNRDKYGRLLRYVVLPDGVMVNATLISEGYAYAYTKFPFEKRDAFVAFQAEARAGHRGLWSPRTCNGIHK